MNQFLTLNEVIAEAFSITPDVDSKEWAVARQWSVTAMLQLGASEDEIRVDKIKADNFAIPKPPDMRKYIELSLFDVNDNFIPHEFRSGRKRIYPDTRVFLTPSATLGATVNLTANQKVYFVPVDVSEDQYNFYLGTANGNTVDYALVRYFAYPLDDQGMPLIRQDEKFAIMCYIRWAKSAKKNENQSEIASNWNLWALQHDRAKAMRKSSDMNNDKAKMIARNWMKLLPVFNDSPY